MTLQKMTKTAKKDSQDLLLPTSSVEFENIERRYEMFSKFFSRKSQITNIFSGRLYKKILMISVLFLSLSLHQSVFAASCEDKTESFDNLQIQQTLGSDGKTCYLTLHPRNAYETMIYRDFLISSQGLLMVFNSFSDSDFDAATGAREFYFLGQSFNGYQWNLKGDRVEVKAFGNKVFQFNTATADLIALSGSQLSIKEEIVPENRGGVEILKNTGGVVLDAGFAQGHSPAVETNQQAVLKNSNNQICKIKNNKLFSIIDGDPQLKPMNIIKTVAAVNCPQFQFK